jgi:hypothetical protein
VALERELMSAMYQPEYRPLWERLFRDRNLRFSRSVERMLQAPATHCVVVGSGHLVGKEGVVALLRSRGLRVTQL